MSISKIAHHCCCKSGAIRAELENRGILPALGELTADRLTAIYLSEPFPSANRIASDYATDAHVVIDRLNKARIPMRPRGEQVRIDMAHGRTPKPPNRWANAEARSGRAATWEGGE